MNIAHARKLIPFMTGAASVALMLSASLSYADDTEIFFGGPSIDEGIRPNVLFILDNSGSMNWRLDSNNNATGSQISRLQVMKQSFADIMSNTNDINVGVMVLNSRGEYGNSRYVYPVEYLDKELPDDIDLIASTPGILQSADDATQAIDPLAAAVIDNPTLVMGVIDVIQQLPDQTLSILGTSGSFFRQQSGNNEYACRLTPPSRPNNPICTNGTLTDLNLRRSQGTMALFHFQGLNLPAGATVSNAYIEITPSNTPTQARRNPLINVQMQNSKSPAALNDNNTLGTRTYQNASDTQVNGWISGNRIAIDVTSRINTLKAAAPAGDPIQGVFVRLTNTNSSNNNTQDYTFCANNCSAGNEPRLIINYTAPGLVPEKRMGALRFQDVGIPQGAVVTSARLDFIPAAANSDPVTFEVRAERSGDANAFANGNNLLSRPKTNALTTWSPANWPNQATPAPIEGPDVTTLVQEVVNQTDWCGNNAMAFYLTPTVGSGTRSAHSFDGAGGLQPTLTVSYTDGEDGCFNSIIETRITANASDGYQAANGSVNLGASTLPLTTNQIGARFTNLPIGRGAQILDAKVIMTPAATVNNPSQVSRISFQNSATANEFSASNNNFSSRTGRTAESNCNIDNTTGWNAGQPVTCDISSLNSALTSIFANSSWDRGNALNMFIRHTSTSALTATAFESNPGQSIKLRLKIRDGGLVRTVRGHVSALVQNMTAADGTPIVPTYLDAVNYFRNSVNGRPSPIDSACQANHIVLLTDGQANNNTTAAKNGIAALAGNCTSDASDDGERCARTLSSWISKNDQSSITGDNFITTHTVGFALDASGATASANIKKFLKEVAENGGGSFSTAENSGELSEAFNRIIQEVLATDTTFVSASAPVNSFERSDNKDELYFALFRPQETNRWPGNLKRYRFSTVDGDGKPNPMIVDVNGLPAVDQLTGQFAAGARSFWSTAADGNNTAAGGAASVLPAPTNRNLYTYVGNPPSTLANLSALNNANTAITNTMLGAADDTERAELFNYIRGLDPVTGAQRKALGDPIHSSPRLVTYSCLSESQGVCAVADQTAFVGSNEGFLHAFNTDTGVEQFAFMPQELLGNIKSVKENRKSSVLAPRRYGMDNPIVLWANDVNGDGKILSNPTDTSPQTGEFIYAYATMGRGGRNIYALDVTNRSAPKMLWTIKGGETAGFEKLGQTWSVPVKTRIRIGSATTPTEVLIFAGGYDANQDNVKVRTPDSMGNAIYIVNAKTGALIWSASNTAGHTLVLPKMQYSMPGNLRVIDLQTSPSGTLVVDKEKLADQIFIGDTGGQVWRLFINNGQAANNLVSAGGTSSDGIFATAIPSNYDTLDLAGKQQNLRRFYNEPDVALLNQDGRLSLSVNIGSGYRGHPLDKNARDIFYSFRTSSLVGTVGSTITTADMFDTTTRLLSSVTNTTEQTTIKGQLNPTDQAKKGGWYIRLNDNGEKVLTRSLTTGQDNIVFFNTYEPGSNNNSCKAAFGISRGYAVNLYDASPYTEWVQGTVGVADRVTDLKTPGLPPQPEQICIGDKCYVILSPDKIVEVDVPTPGKMYWIDQTELE